MSSEFPVVDLFSGAGGLSLGAARAGFSIKGAVENDPCAIEIHNRNFPSTEHISINVCELKGDRLQHQLQLKNQELAGIIGGPPCQGFSYAGKKRRDDSRNILFTEFFRIVSEARPKFFLAENVPGIISNGNHEIVDHAFSLLNDTYEVLDPMPIKANEYGAPTTRTRLFFFGYLKHEMGPLTEVDFNPSLEIEKIYVKDALRGLPEKINPEWQKEAQSWQPVSDYSEGEFSSRLRGHVPSGVGDPVALTKLKTEKLVSGCFGTLHTKEVLERYAMIKPGKREPISRAIRLDLDGFCPTLTAGTGRDHGAFQALRPIHPTEDRAITPREAARLQGFPDWFQFHPTKWHSFRQIGNSVSPIVAEHMLSIIRKVLE